MLGDALITIDDDRTRHTIVLDTITRWTVVHGSHGVYTNVCFAGGGGLEIRGNHDHEIGSAVNAWKEREAMLRRAPAPGCF